MGFYSKLKSNASLKLDLLANFAGTGCSALVQLVCIPFYIKFLGVEGYGLLGFYLTLQALMQVLDLGASPTVNRELARCSAQPEKASQARDLVRTLEAGYWLIGAIVGFAILMAAPLIASHWIKATSITGGEVRQAVQLMGVLAFLQWPLSFYQGGLMGLGRQVLFNATRISQSAVANGGAVLVLWLGSPTIRAFFLWLVFVNAIQVSAVAFFLWKSLPVADRPARFDLIRLQGVWRFAAGMSGIAITSLLLTQTDKLIVSKLLSLRIFGYYTLAWTVASGLSMIAGAVFNVLFPRMSAQVAAGDEYGLRDSYHRGSQLIAVLVLPLAAMLSLFSYDILRLWTRSNQTAMVAAPILRVLVIGSAVNALLYLPYVLQLASGWTQLTFLAGLVSMAVLLPVMFPATKYFGPVGAAAVWAILNILNMFVAVPIMHRRLLPGELWGYFRDVGLPLVCVTAAALLGRLLFQGSGSRLVTVLALSIVGACTLIVAVLAAPRVRSQTLAWVMNGRFQFAQ